MLNIEDRVNSDFLGNGEIIKIIAGSTKGVFAYLVLFDKTPPVDYNTGKNPCLVFSGGIKKIV